MSLHPVVFIFTADNALASGAIQILVITADPVDEAGIAYFPIFSYEAQLAIAKNHCLVEKSRIDPEDLAKEVVITYPVDQNRLDLFTGFLQPAGVEPRRCGR